MVEVDMDYIYIPHSDTNRSTLHNPLGLNLMTLYFLRIQWYLQNNSHSPISKLDSWVALSEPTQLTCGNICEVAAMNLTI